MRTEKQRPKSWKETSASFKEDGWKLVFVGFEWLCECASYGLSRLAFLKVLEYLGKLTILISLILWIYPGWKERRQGTESAKQAAADARISRHYVAWQTINSAMGKPGNGGRADALHDLSQDGIPMDGISLAGHVVLLGPLNLANARMARADFSDAEFEKVSFEGAEFMMSKWDNAKSAYCDFRGASFWGVAFNSSSFSLCDFGYAGEGKTQRASDFLVNFQGGRSQFTMCNFAGAEIPLGIWNSVSFSWCNLAYAHLWHPFIGTNVSIEFCNLYGATTMSPELIKWAFRQRVVFANIVTLEKWHYCVTNRLEYKTGSPEFVEWASNQFNTYVVTNNPKAWLDWSRENLKN
jgi:hypothetical protein